MFYDYFDILVLNDTDDTVISISDPSLSINVGSMRQIYTKKQLD